MSDTEARRDEAYRAGETTLLLVDMQRIWLEPGLDPDHRDWGRDHYFYRQTADIVIPNQQRLLESARAARVEVVHAIIRSNTQDGRDRSLDHKLSSIHVRPDAPEALPMPAVAPLGDEMVVTKTSSGVFNSTNIDYLLRNMGTRYLVVAGILTDQCVDMTVRDAADRGYMVTCIADACAAPTQERHENALRAFAGYCWTADTATVVQRFQQMADTLRAWP